MSNINTAGSGNAYATNELKVDMQAKTWKAFPDVTPLIAIWSKLKKGSAHNIRVDHLEENKIPTVLTVAIDEASAASGTINITEGYELIPDDTLLYNPRTYDIQRVNGGAPSSNALSVTASSAGTTSSAKWLSGDEIHVLPPVIEEDLDTTLTGHSRTQSNVYNYTQLVKLQFKITRTADKLTTWQGGPGSTRMRLKQQKYYEFREKWEKLVYFGGRAAGSGTAQQRTMGGLAWFLKDGTLFKDFGGLFTETGWDNYLGSYLDENPDARNIAACIAPNVIRQINYFCKDKIRISPNTKKYGLNIQQYTGGPLNVDLIPLPLMTGKVVKGWGFLLDFARIELDDLDPAAYYPDAKSMGESEIIWDTYRVLTTMRIATESRHSMFVGADL